MMSNSTTIDNDIDILPIIPNVIFGSASVVGLVILGIWWCNRMYIKKQEEKRVAAVRREEESANSIYGTL